MSNLQWKLLCHLTNSLISVKLWKSSISTQTLSMKIGKSKLKMFSLWYHFDWLWFTRTIEKERPTKQRKAEALIDWQAYYSHDEINAWVESLKEEFPQWISVEDIGHSYEGRRMKVVKLSKKAVLKINLSVDFLFPNWFFIPEQSSNFHWSEYSRSRMDCLCHFNLCS